jgi:predicted NAD-dependent protein-ADP-ribosyltransferase YbiA (DUF1768 family)
MPDVIDFFTGEWEVLDNYKPPLIRPWRHVLVWPPATVIACYWARMTVGDTMRGRILRSSPEQAVRLARTERARRTGDWHAVMDISMLTFLRLKFNFKPAQEILLASQDAFLLYNNTRHDNYWGNCTCDECGDAEGQNRLGTLLMSVRREYRPVPAQPTIQIAPLYTTSSGGITNTANIWYPGQL